MLKYKGLTSHSQDTDTFDKNNRKERFLALKSLIEYPKIPFTSYTFQSPCKGEGEDVEKSRETWKVAKSYQADRNSGLELIDSELEKTFLQLAHQWRRETRGISSTNQASMHPAYQQIIGMGKAVIPLLLRELERNSGQWFWAIKAISREDPVPPEKRGQTQEMIRYWLEWGKQNGYRW